MTNSPSGPSALAAETPTAPAYTGRVRYTPTAARSYQVRDRRKHEAEMKLVERAFRLVPKGHVLDAPCGGGRVGLWLAKQGYDVTMADLSPAMLEFARTNAEREGLKIEVGEGDVESLKFGDRSFDAVISFRLFHHFPNKEIRARVVAELCRVSRRHVLLSYFSPWALTSIKRRIQKKMFGRKLAKFATPLSEIRTYFGEHGFKLVKNFARAPIAHTLNLAVFERRQSYFNKNSR